MGKAEICIFEIWLATYLTRITEALNSTNTNARTCILALALYQAGQLLWENISAKKPSGSVFSSMNANPILESSEKQNCNPRGEQSKVHDYEIFEKSGSLATTIVEKRKRPTYNPINSSHAFCWSEAGSCMSSRVRSNETYNAERHRDGRCERAQMVKVDVKASIPNQTVPVIVQIVV